MIRLSISQRSDWALEISRILGYPFRSKQAQGYSIFTNSYRLWCFYSHRHQVQDSLFIYPVCQRSLQWTSAKYIASSIPHLIQTTTWILLYPISLQSKPYHRYQFPSPIFHGAEIERVWPSDPTLVIVCSTMRVDVPSSPESSRGQSSLKAIELSLIIFSPSYNLVISVQCRIQPPWISVQIPSTTCHTPSTSSPSSRVQEVWIFDVKTNEGL